MANNKDKIIGAVIMVVGLLLIVGYILWGPVELYFDEGTGRTSAFVDSLRKIPGYRWQWAVVIPLTLIVILIGLLAAWIGYSMLTTPPPVPLEELEAELEAEEAASKADAESESE